MSDEDEEKLYREEAQNLSIEDLVERYVQNNVTIHKFKGDAFLMLNRLEETREGLFELINEQAQLDRSKAMGTMRLAKLNERIVTTIASVRRIRE